MVVPAKVVKAADPLPVEIAFARSFEVSFPFTTCAFTKAAIFVFPAAVVSIAEDKAARALLVGAKIVYPSAEVVLSNPARVINLPKAKVEVTDRLPVADPCALEADPAFVVEPIVPCIRV
jgi:hypothetical protein